MNIKLKKSIWILFILSLILQTILVILSDGSQVDDMTRYEFLAKRIAHTGEFYPNNADLHAPYIHSPGYVNFLGLLLIMFGTIKSVLFFNVILNAILALEIFYLGKKYFNETTGYITLLIFTLYPTTYGIVSYAGSELPYIVLVFTTLILYAKGNTKLAVLAGILAVGANWIRPFLPVIVLVIIFMTFFFVNKEKRLKNFLSFAVTVCITILVIGGLSWNRFGYFVFQATTSGNNMIQGANDDADGSYEPIVFEPGNRGYLTKVETDSMTFFEKDAFWRAQSIEWIRENPTDWLLLFPYKLFFMYSHDSHGMSSLSGDITLPVQTREYNMEMVKSFPHWNAFQWLMLFNQLFYLLCLLVSFSGIYYVIKKRNKMGYTLLLYWILGTGATLVAVGANRYHYPFIPVIFIFASYALTNMRFFTIKMFK